MESVEVLLTETLVSVDHDGTKKDEPVTALTEDTATRNTSNNDTTIPVASAQENLTASGSGTVQGSRSQEQRQQPRRRTENQRQHRSNQSTFNHNAEGREAKSSHYTHRQSAQTATVNNNTEDQPPREMRTSSSYGSQQTSSNNQGGHRERYQQRYYQKNDSSQSDVKKNTDDMSLMDLNVYARQLGIVGASLMTKAVLLERIKYLEQNPDTEIEVAGVLERLPDGFGFLRSASYEYVSGPDDIYVSPSQVRRFNLRTGDMIVGVIRKPKDGEKYFALLKVKSVNGQDPAVLSDRSNFDRLTPMHPDKKCVLEFNPTAISTRIMDLFTPIGQGQRALLVAPPRVGKTVLLKELAQSFMTNHPDMTLVILLIDERPEEVADMRKMIKGTGAEVVSSTFDESAERHVQVAEIVIERAKRLVEIGKHVVIFLDSITRLARAYNTIAPASGKVLTGGIDANALQHPKRIFGAARAVEEGGSLTIIGTALIDTGSRMDEVIFEEFKGTGNSEIHMTRKLSHRRIYPAFDLLISGTRREDLLQDPDELNKVWVLQKLLATMNTAEGMEFLIEKMKRFKTNQEFLESINKKQQ